MLGIYLVVKFGQLAFAGNLKYLFTSGLMSVLFWAEILIGVVVPMVLFSIQEVSPEPQWIADLARHPCCSGMILNRFNVSWFAVKHPDPLTYMPTFHGQCALTSRPFPRCSFRLASSRPASWPSAWQ